MARIFKSKAIRSLANLVRLIWSESVHSLMACCRRETPDRLTGAAVRLAENVTSATGTDVQKAEQKLG